MELSFNTPKNQRECLKAMKRLLVWGIAQNIKNPTIALLPPILTMGGVEVANAILNHLVVVHSSQVRSTTYVTYVHLIFS
jgi:hypothetical protein